jgi:hypothetical protein
MNMAHLSDLVSALAHITGLPVATIFAYGRFAREAGLIAQKGRGRGAATMEVGDAANLLIGLGGTAVTRESPLAIRSYRAMKGVIFKQYQYGFAGDFADYFRPLGFDFTPIGDFSGEPRERKCKCTRDFGDLLELLILDAGLGNLTRWLLTLPLEAMPYHTVLTGHEQLRIIFHWSEPSVSIQFRHAWGKAFELWFKPHGRQQKRRALHTSTTLTQDCLTALGMVLMDLINPDQLKRPQALTKIYEAQAEGLLAGHVVSAGKAR